MKKLPTTIQPFFLFPAILLISMLCFGCTFHKPSAKIDSVKLASITFEELSTNFRVAVKNPNDIGLTMAGFRYDLSMEGHSIVKGTKDGQLRIDKKATSKTWIPVSIKYKDIWDAIQSVQGKDKVKYALSAEILLQTPIGKLPIPLKHKGTLPVLRPPKIQFRNIKVTGQDLSGVRAEMRLRMKNPNASEIQFRRFEWRISLEDSDILSGHTRKTGSVKPDEDYDLHIPIELDYGMILGSLLRIIQNKGDAKYHLEGRMVFDTRYGEINLPLIKDGQVSFH